jgi:hypothetical protein
MFSLISLKLLVLRLACPMFSLEVSVLRLADTQQPAAAAAAASFLQAAHQSNHPPIQSHQSPKSSFRESFIYSGKQGGGATVLREGCDIVTRETCIPTSLNVNILGNPTVLHFALF